MLVGEFVARPFFGAGEEEILDRIDALAQEWTAHWNTGRPGSYATLKGDESSAATLTGLQFSVSPGGAGGTWRCYALGDSCLFHVSGGSLKNSIPFTRPEDFGSHPWLFSTRRATNEQAITHSITAEGTWQDGDQIFLLTDVIAQWFLRQHQAGHRPWEVLADADELSLRALLEQGRRLAQMRDDDVAIVGLSFAHSSAAKQAQHPWWDNLPSGPTSAPGRPGRPASRTAPVSPVHGGQPALLPRRLPCALPREIRPGSLRWAG
jgi:hypothetical protein